MAALIPFEKCLVLLEKQKFDVVQAIIQDKCCHLGLMEPRWSCLFAPK